MKKKLSFLLLLSLILFFNNQTQAQCVPTCSAYAVSPIGYSLFPTGVAIPTTSFSPNPDDGITPLIPIGFSFNFYCTVYTDLWICTNGFLQFNDGVPAVSTGYVDPAQLFPNPAAPNTMVTLNMTDLDLSLGGSISYTTVGVSPNQIFILTFSNVPIYGDLTSPNTGQILLYETSNLIEIHTGTVINNSTPSSVQGIQYGTQGIENANGTAGTVIPGRNQAVWSASNNAYQFSPYSPTPAPAISGPATICSGLSPTYSISPAPGSISYSWFTDASWIGTSTTTAYTGIVGSSSTLSVTANYTCGVSQPATLAVAAIAAPTVNVQFVYPSTVCSGNDVIITVNGATDYTLDPGGITTVSGISYTVTPNATTDYSIVGTDASNCLSYNTAIANVSVNPTPQISVNSGSMCAGQGFTMSPSGGGTYVYSNGSPVVNPPIGVYSYTVNSTVDGCVGIPAVSNLTVYSMPNTSAVNPKANVCKSDQINLFAFNAQNYLWSTGATTSLVSITHNTLATMGGSATVIYSVTGTNAGGCSKTATVSVTVYLCTDIKEQTGNATTIVVYPNPNAGEFTIQTEKEITVSIYDIQGKLVLNQNMKEGNHTVNLNQQSSGQYLLKAISEEGKQQNVVLIKE